MWKAIVADMREHKPECEIADIIDLQVEGRSFSEKVPIVFDDTQTATLKKVICRILNDLGPLAEKWGMINEFSLCEAK